MQANEVMQLDFDPERLIKEVKKRPGIWDFEDPDYRAKHIRHKLWVEVVRTLMPSDIKLSKSEMRVLELQLQKKWKSIRDCFQKHVARPNMTRRPYIYTKQLQFLLKTQEEPENDGSSDSDDVVLKHEKKVWRTRRTLKLKNPEPQSSEEYNDNDNADSQVMYLECSNDGENVEIPTKMARVSNTNNINEFAFANVDVVKSDDDPEKLFLLSLLPHMKSIPEEFRLNVKMDMMQVLKNATYMSTRDHKLL